MPFNKYTSENIRVIKPVHKQYLLNGHVTGWCNYHCPYCINKNLIGGDEFTPEERLIDLAIHIDEHINKRVSSEKLVHFRLIGGEPAFYNWPKILNHITRVDRITMVTNFSRDNEFYKDLFEYCANRHIVLYLICSWHEETTNFKTKVAELQNWISQNSYATRQYQLLQVSLLAKEDFSQDLLDSYAAAGVNKVRISIMRDENQIPIKLTDEQLQIINNWNNKYQETVTTARTGPPTTGLTVKFKQGLDETFVNQTHLLNLLNDGFDPVKVNCSAGRDTLTCYPNGDISLCKCEALKNSINGNFLNDDIPVVRHPIPCPLKQVNPNGRCQLCFGTEITRTK